MVRLIIFISIFILFSAVLGGQTVVNLNQGWTVEYDGKQLPAKVPGNIFLDLYGNGIIDNPLYADNEQHVQWVSRRKWVYTKKFLASGKKNTFLVFDGLDTHAKVYLNDSLVLQADNMFRTWSVEVSNILKDTNILQIEFFPPLLYDSLQAANYPFRLPDNRAFSRKAPYQYGWDWGAKLVTVGIWKNVYLKIEDKIEIRDLYVEQRSIEPKRARLVVHAVVFNPRKQKLKLKLKNVLTGKVYDRKMLILDTGETQIDFAFSIKNPRLWWPRGMGRQNLYCFELNVDNGEYLTGKKITTGLREVRLVREKDSIGESFYFEVNGRRVFVKGANYIPQSQFPSQVSDSMYFALVHDAAAANMNMLRVWGGGIYQRDTFYSLCDKYGIMLWQDFMFACNFYPADSAFLYNVRKEAEEQVRRLRNHPSIVLWCGNNEVKEAWYNWGYQRALDYTDKDSAAIWHGQQKIFDTLLLSVVNEYCPDISYVSSSPQNGWGRDIAYKEGDVHFWGVWWARWPFEEYTTHVGRFVSEYGFQSFPQVETMLTVLDSSGLRLDAPALLNHQKHPFGMENIQNYMLRYFGLPSGYETLYLDKKDIPPVVKPAQDTVLVWSGREELNDVFGKYVFYSQLTQAYGVGIAIEAHRRAKPYCMGTLYWQLNDTWPVISWSSRDYYGRWKALHYKVRDLYKTVIISGVKNGNNLDVYIVSDSLESIEGHLVLTFKDFEGKVLGKYEKNVTVTADTSQKVLSVNLQGYDTARTYAEILFSGKAGIIAQKTVFLTYPKNLDLQKPVIDFSVHMQDSLYIINLRSDKLVYAIELLSGMDGYFSDNYFTMQPGRVYKVFFRPVDTMEKKKITLRYRVYR